MPPIKNWEKMKDWDDAIEWKHRDTDEVIRVIPNHTERVNDGKLWTVEWLDNYYGPINMEDDIFLSVGETCGIPKAEAKKKAVEIIRDMPEGLN